MQPKFWGACQRCHQYEWCAVDAGYSWKTGNYTVTDKAFNADYYAFQTECQLGTYPLVCAVMGPRSRKRFAGAVSRAVKQSIDLNPNTKPDYRTVRDAVANDPELKGFIPTFILMAIFGWVIEQILDFIWNNWTAMPNGEPKP